MTHKVLIHLSDRNNWWHVLTQADILLGELEGARVVILADRFAGAFCVSCGKELLERMEKAAAAGIEILVCEESLNALNIKKEKLPGILTLVPASYPEILKKIQDRFLYICAG